MNLLKPKISIISFNVYLSLVILSDSWIIYPNTMVASQGSSSTSFISDAYIGSASTIINNKNVALFCGGNTPIAGAAWYNHFYLLLTHLL